MDRKCFNTHDPLDKDAERSVLIMATLYPSTPQGIARLASRFWARVNKDGPVPERFPELGPCWIWTGGRTTNQYGRICVCNAYRPAHRIALYLTNGYLPDHLQACHKCDVPLCVNPSHLFLGTAKDNTRDMMAKGRHLWFGSKNPDDWVEKREAGRARGERVSRAKITSSQAMEIRDRLLNVVPQSQVARECGVPESAVRGIYWGETWRHIISDEDVRSFEAIRAADKASKDERARSIIEMIKNGATINDIAAHFAMTYDVAGTIVFRLLKRHGMKYVVPHKTHCVRGHEFTPANTYIRPGSRANRMCRACRAMRHRKVLA